MTKYTIRTRVISVREKQSAVRSVKTSDDGIKVEYANLGWFAHFEGSWESIFLGMEKPDLATDDLVKITIEKD